MAEYLSDRGFALITYYKSGVGPNFTISDSNAWGTLTFSNLGQNARRLYHFIAQPEVNATKKATLLDIAKILLTPRRVAVDNPYKVRNIILMAPVAEKWIDLIYFQEVANPILYAEKGAKS